MTQRKKKLGRLTINGKEVDSEKFIKDFHEKYGLPEDYLKQAQHTADSLSNKHAEAEAKKMIAVCEINCGAGIIFDFFGTNRCPKCGGPVKKIFQ